MPKKLLFLVIQLLLTIYLSQAQDVLMDFNFQSTELPTGVSTDGTISTGGPINSCTECSIGRLVLDVGGYMQTDISSCGRFIVKMKSSGSTARVVTVKYKHSGDADYSAAGTLSVVQAGTGVYDLISSFPEIETPGPTSIRLENAPAGGQLHIHDLYIESNSTLFSEAEIIAFKLTGQIGDEIIDSQNTTIDISMPLASDLSSVVPDLIGLSPSAIISPSADTARDFSVGNDVIYNVTSQDGNTVKQWTVTVSQLASWEKEITSFILINNQIGASVIDSNNGTVDIIVPQGTDLTNLVPVEFTISNYATINPTVSTSRDFSNPLLYTVTAQDGSTKDWIITVTQEVPIYDLSVSVSGIGNVTLSLEGGSYPEGTLVTLTANSVFGSTFTGWSGDLTGTNSVSNITMDANKNVTANFDSDIELDFETPIGFASMNTGSTYPDYGHNFSGSVTGGQNATDTLWVNGPDDFDMLAWHLYYRNRAYRGLSGTNGVTATPLVIVFKEGVYEEGTSASSAWGNSMLTVQEQGDLTIIGEHNVVLKFGFNIKRSWNILIRNITFYDYYDDGINIGEPETHHIWVDHCTVGHPTSRSSNQDHPDGGIDIKAGASYVTLSWNLLRNSWKTNLIGHSDSNASEDLGKLKVTLYANYYYNSNSRNPRVRFGEVHVLNNLVEAITLYGIAASNLSQVYAENNFYLNTRWPMYADRSEPDFQAVYGVNTDNTFTSKTGNYPCTALKQVGNAYDDLALPVITSQINPAMLNPGGRSVKFDEFNVGGIFEPLSYYAYTPMPAEAVEEIVPLYAGADVVDFFNNQGLDVVSFNTQSLFKAFPNPVTDYMTLLHPVASTNGKINIYNISGALVKSIKVETNTEVTNLDFSYLKSGFYMVQYKDESNKYQYSFIKR